nr:helix-turn-helix transcriptional regulator [Nocardioides thalensis]
MGTFLRTRRESVRPEDVGLPRGERRRTPGLRRAEVATLAGISVEYLTRLEQGRDSRPSTQVVAAIADALRLDAADRMHLHHLVALSQGTELVCAAGCPDDAALPQEMAALLERLGTTPAAVIGPRTELVGWTDSFELLVGPLGMLEGEQPELVRYAFLEASARQAVPDWDTFADAQVAWLHLQRGGVEPEVVAELAAAAGQDFAARWAGRPTGPLDTGLRAVVHPEVGLVRLQPQVLLATGGLALAVHLPADAAADTALDRLVGRRPRGLRSAQPPAPAAHGSTA